LDRSKKGLERNKELSAIKRHAAQSTRHVAFEIEATSNHNRQGSNP